MVPKKKTKKATKPKRATAKKVTPGKRSANKKTAKALTAKKSGQTKRSTKARKSRRREQVAFEETSLQSRSGSQSGDLQGLQDRESVDSESETELLEEGNAFEAGVVEGVERAEDDGVREVRTREVPEDDVPSEYLDQD